MARPTWAASVLLASFLLSVMVTQPTTAGDAVADAVKALGPKAAPGARLEALGRLRKLMKEGGKAEELHAAGGVAPLVSLLSGAHDAPTRAAAARALRAAAAGGGPAFVSLLVSGDPGLPAALLEVSQLPDDGAARHGLAALGAVVRSSREARAAFYAVSGLAHLEAAAGGGDGAKAGPAASKARSKALRLLSDLLELAFEASNLGDSDDAGGGGGAVSEDDAVEALAGSVVPQFASAALRLLADADGLRGRETALLALRTLLARRRADGCAVMATLGGEAALRTALASLGGELDGDGGVAIRGPGPDEDEAAAELREYLANICADILDDVAACGEDEGDEHDEL